MIFENASSCQGYGARGDNIHQAIFLKMREREMSISNTSLVDQTPFKKSEKIPIRENKKYFS